MKNYFKIIPIYLLISCGLLSCSNDNIPRPPLVLQDTVSSTVLVYMVGQNSLASDLADNINTMMTGMKDAPYGANWLVYIDTNKEPKLYQLVKDDAGNVTKKLLNTYSDQYSTDVSIMRDVINEVYERFPAENYGLILSSHADGWFPAPRTIEHRAFGEEWTSNGTYYMDITDMADALAGVPHLKYILFDACLMGAVEVAYEFRNVADYLLASPASVVSMGMPYANLVTSLLKMTEKDFETVLDRYYTAYQNYFGTLSAIRLNKMEKLANAFQTLMQTESGIHRANTITRTDEMQLFEPDYPIYDFGQLVDSLGVHNEEAVALVKAALAETLVHTVHTEYSTINVYSQQCYNEILHYSGLTSYIPPATVFSETTRLNFYKDLDWYEASGWNLSNRFGQ